MRTRGCRALAVAAAVLVLGAVGCTDTTVEPKSTITDANVFNDVNSYKAFLARIYIGLGVSGQQGPAGQPDIQGIDEGFSQYLRLWWQLEELPTDEAVIAWGDQTLPELNTQQWSPPNRFTVAMYYRIYFQVAMANEFLRQTTDEELSARGVSAALKTQVEQYRAEARFLRALSYWHGIDLFGNIPLVTEDDAIGATPPQQNTREEVFQYVVDELNAIKDELPQPGASSYGRATGPAASMLLAKLYLNSEVYTGTAQWTEAMAATQDAIAGGYTLDPVYRHMFMADNNTSPELIFVIPQDGLKTQTYGGMTFLVHASVGGSMAPSNYGIDGGWYGLRLKPEAYNLFGAGDERSSYFYTDDQSVEVTSIGNFNAGVAAPKYTNIRSDGQPASHNSFVDVDYPVFRLGDAYLMYAEAFLRGGGGTEAQALAYVNALRERAFGDTSHDITAAQLTLPFILAERGRELLWEGTRRTDLVRFGQFTGGDYIWSWKGGTEAGSATDSYRDLYPLPSSELIANPNLKQNPGY